MSYSENKKKIDKIREKYNCYGDLIFRSALPIVVEVGQCTILDDTWYQCEIDDIYARHDVAEKEGKILFVTRDFEKAIFECARDLANIKSYDLLTYVQKEVWLGGNGISYKRAISLLKRALDVIGNKSTNTYAYFKYITLDDIEIEELGYGVLLDGSYNEPDEDYWDSDESWDNVD